MTRPRMRAGLAAGLVVLLIAAACGTTGAPASPSPGSTPAPTATPEPTVPIGSPERPIVMAFTPSAEIQRVTTTGNAIAAALGQATGMTWRVIVPTSYAAQVEAMCAGQVDIAFIAPLQMTLLLDKKCGTPILSALRFDETGQLSTYYNSQILVRSDSGINTLQDLRGKKFAFSDPISASGYLFPLLTIKQETGMEPRQFFSDIVFAGGHGAVVLAVYNGSVDGGSTFTDARVRTVGTTELAANMPADVLSATKVISKAGPIPNDGIAVSADLPDDVVARIKQALLDYAATEDGKTQLRALFNWNGMQEVGPDFYNSMFEAARLGGVDVEGIAAQTPRPPATPTPTPTQSP